MFSHFHNQEQDKSSHIEQQPPFDDRKYSNTLPQKREKIQNQREQMQFYQHSINIYNVWCILYFSINNIDRHPQGD